MKGFSKILFPCILKGLHIHFNLSQNVSRILLPSFLVMVTNEASIACKCFK